MRVWLTSITCLRKPAKLPGPADPTSSQVVVPQRLAKRVGVDADGRAAPIDVRVEVDVAGHHDTAGDVARR